MTSKRARQAYIYCLNQRPIGSALVVLLHVFAILPLPMYGNTIKAIKLKQTHEIFGDVDVLIARSGLRLGTKGTWGFNLVTSAPDWKVTVYRDDDKTYITLPLRIFEKAGLVSMVVQTKKERTFSPLPRESNFTIGGIPAKRMLHYQRWQRVYEYIPPSAIAPQVEKVIYAAYNIPTCGGFPLRYLYDLKTESAKAVQVSANAFNPPRNYTIVRSIQAVLLSQSARGKRTEEVQELFHAH